VRRKPGAAVVEAVPTLYQQHFVAFHRGRPVPALVRRMRELIDFAGAVREDLIDRDQLVHRD